MKKFFAVYLFLLISKNLLAQQIPLEFPIGENRFSKLLDPTPIGNTIERILIQDNTIWLATSKGLTKSTNNGETWTNYYNTKEFGEEAVSAIGYHNGEIWAATWHIENKYSRNIPVGTGLKYSTDQGQTWNIILQPIDASTDTLTIYGVNSIKTIPKNNQDENFVYSFAFTQNTVWIVSARGGLRKSTDRGQTWQRVVLPPDNIDSIKPTDKLNFTINPNSTANHIALSVYAVDDQTIFVGTQGGINKSTDGGISWVKFTHANQTQPISGNNVFTIDRNEYDNSIWIATTQIEFPSVCVTYDEGQSWGSYLSGEAVRGFGFKYHGNPGAYTGAEVFAASENGLFRTSNKGATWIAAPPIIDDVTKFSLNKSKFLSVEAEKKSDSSYNIWIGSSGDGLIRFNETGGAWSGKWKIFLAKEKIESGGTTYAFPNPFAPNAESVRIIYSTSTASNVTVRIFDFGMNLVRTLIQNASRSISDEQIEIWDGRDEGGRIVHNGVYFYRIDIGSDKPLFGKIMVLM